MSDKSATREALRTSLTCVLVIVLCVGAVAIPLTRGWILSARDWFVATFAAHPLWTGIYYRDAKAKAGLAAYFKTLDECREWAQTQATLDHKQPGEWDYACGYKCNNPDSGFSFQCEQLTK